MKVCLIIPDGVGVRNYLYSDLIPNLINNNAEVVIWHSLDKTILREIEQLHNIKPLTSIDFVKFTEPTKIRLWREAISYARLILNVAKTKNKTILSNWNKKNNNLKRKILYSIAKLLGSFWVSEERILKEEKRLFSFSKSSTAYNFVREQLLEIKPDFIFCTHQRIPEGMPIMLAAQDLGIQSSTAIFSWDNLPKARLPFRTDMYFVWSDYMRKELRYYYPEVKDEQIFVTGTPQFDFYKKSELIVSREEFAKKYKLNKDKSWVLFSGDDKTTSPYDSHYLNDVAEALSMDSSIELLFRQVPVETVERYKKVLNKFLYIKHIPPRWNNGSFWTMNFPKFEDVKLLVNLAYHCNTVINIGSTMALDFAVFNRPALYINYDFPFAKNWSVKTIYNFQHFETLKGIDAVGWINKKSDILNCVQQSIKFPNTVGSERLIWLERVTGFSLDLSSDFISKIILKSNAHLLSNS
ncbi:hypothetical protein [Flexithrix dorotheae]|uniref:hypothetical protein n=1 Tax=Flexithrix dorotheae TaxID=70993 RepID=UPI00037998B3|nr:hypothetical protein [Flexithrix dorotheae]